MDGGGMMGPGGNMGPPGNNMVSKAMHSLFSSTYLLDPSSYYSFSSSIFLVVLVQRVSFDLPKMLAVGELSRHSKLWKVVGKVTRTLFRS